MDFNYNQLDCGLIHETKFILMNLFIISIDIIDSICIYDREYPSYRMNSNNNNNFLL